MSRLFYLSTNVLGTNKMKFIILVVLMISPCIVFSEVYRWVDEAGNVHYGDKPVGNSATELNINKSNKDTLNTRIEEGANEAGEELSRDEKRQKLLDAMQEDRTERNKIRKLEAKKKKELNARCARARDKLRNLKRASGVYNLDKNGERVYVSKEKRMKGEASFKKSIKKHCK